jgi:hypothetical protein
MSFELCCCRLDYSGLIVVVVLAPADWALRRRDDRVWDLGASAF